MKLDYGSYIQQYAHAPCRMIDTVVSAMFNTLIHTSEHALLQGSACYTYHGCLYTLLIMIAWEMHRGDALLYCNNHTGPFGAPAWPVTACGQQRSAEVTACLLVFV